MKTTDTGHLLSAEHARIIVDHIYSEGETGKSAIMDYLTKGIKSPRIDPIDKILIDEGLQGGLDYLIECAKSMKKGIEKIQSQGFELY